ncbi:N-fatty-acyl-amino acid synthase/hydrolase PM20D1-like [Oppia nitens]|uniref:N-fatty-acyl-amino acid synthase/hydrolase PM20D1-like n=1 Tax=Oppia nitens TaxID=1686743 RepID=UPI0023DC10EC|nr:N-fatty-acyl-amino acid synthase/hydrolase PM20D1-like [Oppia nitens]
MVKLTIATGAQLVTVAIGLLGLIIILRAVIFFPTPPDPVDCRQQSNHTSIDNTDGRLVNRFIRALRFRTITRAPQVYDSQEIKLFIEFLNKSFPAVHTSPSIGLTIINEHSLLYHIRGSDPSLKPYLLLAHMDVVPAEEDKWHSPPYDGTVRPDGYIYGRGTVDLKDVLMGILESLEFLAETRHQFRRSFYVAIGHDEEGRGLDGARQTASYLRNSGVTEFEYILDEGPFILERVIMGTSRSVAMIGVTEKGFVNVRLTANGKVGHSSVPPPETSIVALSRAVAKFTAYTHPNQFGRGPERQLIESIAPYATFAYKLLYANLWLFGPLVSRLMETDNTMNSFIRTSTAVTMFKSGVKDNILPGDASATVNHRIYPLSSVREVLEFDRQLIADDDRIQVEILGVPIEPHPISPRNRFGYQVIRESIREVFPQVVVIPGVMLAATDTRWFLNFTRNIYRFSPAIIPREDMDRFHGHDERISVDNYVKLVNFYHHIIIGSDDSSHRGFSSLAKDEL